MVCTASRPQDRRLHDRPARVAGPHGPRHRRPRLRHDDGIHVTPLDEITAAIRTVLADTGRSAPDIAPGRLLTADLGLDSLDLAQTIVLLERSLGIDPFRQAAAVENRPTIRTVADLVAIYTSALSSPPSQTP
ncbi:MAG: acyl carrier protein [Planctomycetia bacterium]|nr:acyl carrier protein [Planctomycetia bacterium]